VNDRRPGSNRSHGNRSGRPREDRAPRPAAPTARSVAFDVISAVRDSDAYANLLLPGRIARARLSPADAALATELTYGTLRMQGYYDRVIARAAGRPVDRIDPPILDVLRL
jgi:16S rRNA (cytosine967-C5)-methyltransferase